MKLIGVVASSSKTSVAPMLVFKDAEGFVKEEALVVVEDAKTKKKYLGVVRSLTKLDPLLTHTQRSAIIERPELADESLDLPYETNAIRIIGELTEKRLEPPSIPPTPRSKVYLVESPADLELNLGEGLKIGVHKYSGVEVSLLPEALRYHIAVVGTTGTGKSRLVKAVIDEALEKTSWSIVVFDHTGVDYAPYWPDNIVGGHEVALDIETITTGLKLAVGAIENLIEEYVPIALAYYAMCASRTGNAQKCVPRNIEAELANASESLLEDAVIKVAEAKQWSAEDLARIAKGVAEHLGARPSTLLKLNLYVRIYGEHFVKRLNSMRYRIDDLIAMAKEKRLVVIDLSTVETEIRRVIVKRVLERLWEIISETLEPMNMLVVVDEAHNYACDRGCYPSNMLIEKTLREGRKWGVGVILASQRVIDFSPDVRNNVNTVFFSKLQTPYDFNQLQGFVDLAGITADTLALLEKREFFFAGYGNPLKYPLLIKVREVAEPRRVLGAQ